MRDFVRLVMDLDGTTSTNAKVDHLARYFQGVDPADGAWTLHFLMGRRFKRFIGAPTLRQWMMDWIGIEPWMVEEAYVAVGDTAETISVLLDSFETLKRPEEADSCDGWGLARWVEERILPLKAMDEAIQREAVLGWWADSTMDEVFVLNKVLMGGFRIGVSKTLVIRGLSHATGIPATTLNHRVMGHWEPTATFYTGLLNPDEGDVALSQPYPFCLAHPLELGEGSEPAPWVAEALGRVEDWHLEWKWDGIRGQLIRRQGETFLWSRGEELVNHQFPEVIEAAESLPDGTVLDGELLAWDVEAGKPLPFSAMQKRLGRKTVSAKVRSAVPIIFQAYDLLEHKGLDMRELSMAQRWKSLGLLLDSMEGFPYQRDGLPVIRLSSPVLVSSWEDAVAQWNGARDHRVEGFMLKHRKSPYHVGRKKGDWWKWKVEPFSCDAVLIYAQAGHGRRANLFTDYTFAVWAGEELVPIAKAYSGLSNEEIARLDKWIRANTQDKFGPVRAVVPHHVFELHFEAIAPSPRHKSGIAVRFPRIHRWRTDKPKEEADTLETLQALIPPSLRGEVKETRSQQGPSPSVSEASSS